MREPTDVKLLTDDQIEQLQNQASVQNQSLTQQPDEPKQEGADEDPTPKNGCRFHPRLAPQPCPYCGEQYLLLSPHQKNHTQSPSCQRRIARLATKACARRRRGTTPFEPHLAPEPCQWCGEEYMLLTPWEKWHQNPECRREYNRVRSGWRFIHHRERQRQRGEPLPRPAKLLTNPLGWARWQALLRYKGIYKRFPEDTIQELRLALLEHGIRDFDQPASLDISGLQRSIMRHMYGLGRDLGFNPRLTRRHHQLIPEGLEERPTKDWTLVWRTCA